MPAWKAGATKSPKSRILRSIRGLSFTPHRLHVSWTRPAWLAIVAFMQLLSGKDAVNHVAGIIHAKYQVHGFSVHLTVRKIYGIDPAGKLDFGGGEYAPAGRMELAP